MEREEAVIDLGVLAPVGAARPPDDDPGLRQLRGWWDRRRRGIAGGIAVALLLIAAAAAAPPADADPVTIALPPTGYGRFDVVGDLLFVAESHTRWRAYGLPDGERRWSLERPDDAPLGLVAVDGLIVDRLYGAFGATRDPATGRVVLSPSQLAQSTGVRMVQVLTGADPALSAGDYHYYRDASPHPRFARRVTGRLAGWLAGDPPVLVRVSAGGLVELRDPATGGLLTRRYLPAWGSGVSLAAVVGGILVLQHRRADQLVLQGYVASTLAPLWERVVPDPGTAPVWAEQCGPMLCVHHQLADDRATVVDPLTGWLLAGTRTDVTDPATGRTAWVAAPGETQLYPVGERFLAYGGDGALRAVLDARTGRVLRELAGWRAIVPAAGVGAVRVVLTRADHTGQVRLAWLALASAEIDEVAMLPSEPEPCLPFSEGLVCRHGHQLRVWPLGPPLDHKR
ncbi:MAG TPA: hypothetical protein VIL37_02080 [Natronosporangium sp.]